MLLYQLKLMNYVFLTSLVGFIFFLEHIFFFAYISWVLITCSKKLNLKNR